VKIAKLEQWRTPRTLVIALSGIYFFQLAAFSIEFPTLLRRLLVLSIWLVLLLLERRRQMFVNRATLIYWVILFHLGLVWLATANFEVFIDGYGRLRVFVFLIVGYFIATGKDRLRNVRTMALLLLAAHTIGSLRRLPLYLSGRGRSAVTQLSNLELDDIQTDGLVESGSTASPLLLVLQFLFDKRFFFGLLTSALFGAYLFLQGRSRRERFLTGGMTLLCLLTAMAGKMTAVLIAVPLGVGILAFLARRELLLVFRRDFIPLLVVSAIAIAAGIVSSLDVGQLVEAVFSGEGIEKLQPLVDNFLTAPVEALDRASNGRVTRIQSAYAVFLDSPLLGDSAVGGIGHSSVFDVVARYGLIGALPIALLFAQWFRAAFRLWRDPEHKLYGSTMLAVLTVTTIGCVFDRLFMGRVGFDEILLLFGGMTLGLSSSLAGERRRRSQTEFAALAALPVLESEAVRSTEEASRS